jgi:hypothetical protein
MKKNLKGKTVCVLGFFLVLFLTYVRENIALEINASLNHESYSRAYSYMFSDYFNSLPDKELRLWKWVVSISFTAIMSIVTIFSLHHWFSNKEFTRFIIIVYVIAFCVLTLIFMIGYLTNSFDNVHAILRRVTGVVHSPIPFFVFFTLFFFKKK